MSLLQSISIWNRRRLQRRKHDRAAPKVGVTYADWVSQNGALTAQQMAQLSRLADGSAGPLFSVLMPVMRPESPALGVTLKSVLAQVGAVLEVCVAVPQDCQPELVSWLDGESKRDRRVRVVLVAASQGAEAFWDAALRLASGAVLMQLEQGERLPPFALAAVREVRNSWPGVRLIYADDDLWPMQGERCSPHFKPDWNAYLLRSHNYVGRAVYVDKDFALEIEAERAGAGHGLDHDFLLRCAERLAAVEVAHVPLVLHHLCVVDRSRPFWAQVDRSVTAVRAHLSRQSIQAECWAEAAGVRVRYAMPAMQPKVSIVILTRDRPQLLDGCVRSVLEKTEYDNLEVLIVDNGTVDPKALGLIQQFERDPRVKVLRDASAFNYSALNNLAVSFATGDLLCLMNNDIEVLSADWLMEMVSVAMQPRVGCVGARLWFPDGRLQHAGIILGIGGAAGHPFRLQRREDSGYMQRSERMQEMSGVTAACLVTPRKMYLEVGGLDPDNFRVAFNDVDYCLKLRARGLHVIYDPYAELVHHESVSRGYEDTVEKKLRFMQERQHLIDKWSTWISSDPAYNANLTLEQDNFSLALEPRMTPAKWLNLLSDPL